MFVSQISEMLCLFHELMNQYQACLDSFECILHKDSKYSNQIPECLHFLQNLLHFVLTSAHARRIVSIID